MSLLKIFKSDKRNQANGIDGHPEAYKKEYLLQNGKLTSEKDWYKVEALFITRRYERNSAGGNTLFISFILLLWMTFNNRYYVNNQVVLNVIITLYILPLKKSLNQSRALFNKYTPPTRTPVTQMIVIRKRIIFNLYNNTQKNASIFFCFNNFVV